MGAAAAGREGEPDDVDEGDERRGQGAPHGAAPERPELDGAEEPEDHVGQESGRAGQELPGKLEREPAADARVRVDARGGAERRGRMRVPCKKAPPPPAITWRESPSGAPLVVVEVAAQIEHAVLTRA